MFVSDKNPERWIPCCCEWLPPGSVVQVNQVCESPAIRALPADTGLRPDCEVLEVSSPRETLSQIISGVWGWSGPLPEALQKWGEEFVTDGAGKAKSLLYSINSKTHFSPLRLRCFIIDDVSQFNQHFPRRTRLGFRPRSLQTLKRSLPGPGPRLALHCPGVGVV